MAKHTKTPWEQGELVTSCVLSDGEFIGSFEKADDAAWAVRAVNCHDELVEALQMFVAWDDGTHDTSPAAQHDSAMAKARAVLAKTQGS